MCAGVRVCTFTPISQIKWRALCITKKPGGEQLKDVYDVRMDATGGARR